MQGMILKSTSCAALLLTLASCSLWRGKHAARPGKAAPGQSQTARSMPQPPAGASAHMDLPPLGKDGRRVTPNRDLSSAATLWHVRIALNVAALSCDRAGDAARLQYNGFLARHKAVLAKTNRAVNGEYEAAHGAKGVDRRDRDNTRAYNFFALPPVQQPFCRRAVMVGKAVNSKASGDLAGYAPQALASLEQPFLDFYDDYAAYQTRLAGWRRTRGTLSSAR